MRRILCAIATCFALSSCAPAPIHGAAPEGDWAPLFNGRDLSGWTPKFMGAPVGENVYDTFRVEDGLLTVSYNNYNSFNGEYGHLFYTVRPFSHYWLRAEYRFIGRQPRGAPDWGWRNNGLMLHAQPPETMGRDQQMPISVETRLLGGRWLGQRSTGNVCTPGTTVLLYGVRSQEQCVDSVTNSRDYPGAQWVLVEVEVRGGEIVRQFINGVEVLEYTDLRLDRPEPWNEGLRLASGYIAIQAETHPTQFRRIDILVLDDDDSEGR